MVGDVKTAIEARYNRAKGVFEPLEVVDLAEGTKVRVSVEPEEAMSEEEWWEFINDVVHDVRRKMQNEERQNAGEAP